MSILDDAIREHLELKRAHGADESELKRLEDEAFGPPQRPDELDPAAEAPTEFLTAPSEVVEEAAAEVEAEGRRRPNITDLQEPPPAPTEPEAEAPPAEPSAPEPPAPAPEPSFEDQPAGEHRIPPADPEQDQQPVAEQPEEAPAADLPKADGVHTTEEREAIANQPTEMFDVQAEMEAAAPEAGAPEASPAPAPEGEAEDDYEDDFFSEQRLSDELNQAMEAPIEPTDEHELPPLAPEPAPVTEEGTAIYDVEGDAEDEYEEGEEEDSAEHSVYEPETGSHDDVLEDTPDFLEESDADDAWFEQRPPKDFDFDD